MGSVEMAEDAYCDPSTLPQIAKSTPSATIWPGNGGLALAYGWI